MPNTLFEIMEDCEIVVHSARPPTVEEWKHHLELLDKNRTLIRRMFVFSEGAGPDAAQRAQVTDLVKSKYAAPIVTAVVTPDPIARGIGVALKWIYSNIQMFAPDKIDDAYKFLNLNDKQTANVRKLIAGMRVKVSGK